MKYKVLCLLCICMFVLTACSSRQAVSSNVVSTGSSIFTQTHESSSPTSAASSEPTVSQAVSSAKPVQSVPDSSSAVPVKSDLPASSQPQQSFVSKLKVAASAQQIITVVGTGNSKSTLTFHEKQNGVWAELFSANAYIGSDGIGEGSEYFSRTPQGVHGFLFAFGNAPDPGAGVEYRQVTSDIVWVDDPNSKYYNKWVSDTLPDKDWTSAERLSAAPVAYKYSLALDYNSTQVPGKGSAIFLHCSTGKPTAACIAVDESVMVHLLQTVKPGAKLVVAPDMNSLYTY